MCPSAPRVCNEPGGQKPVLSLSLDRIVAGSFLGDINDPLVIGYGAILQAGTIKMGAGAISDGASL